MADRILKSITFPDLPDKYLIPQGDVTKADLENFAENGTVANARQLVASIYEEDKTPYNFRTSGGSLDIGDREYLRKIVGGTVAWNQLNNDNLGWNANRCTIALDDTTYTVTVSTTTYDFVGFYKNSYGFPKNHKLLIAADVKPSTTLSYVSITAANRSVSKTSPTANAWNRVSGIVDALDTGTQFIINFMYPSGTIALNDTHQVRNIQLFDLTQMFGSTIADYIYSLEQANAGAGVAWFKKLFPKDYYAYNAGELISVKTSKHITTGFNQWDEEWEVGALDNNGANQTSSSNIRSKNYISIVPNTSYYFNTPNNMNVYWYDADKNFISIEAVVASGSKLKTSPSNAHYARFYTASAYGTTYKNDICINLAWDNSRNGEYEPYEAHEYSIDDVELRGILKLDSNNNLCYDGDEYGSDGTVTRRYGIVDLGTLSWTYSASTFNGAFVTALNDMIQNTAGSVCSKYQSVDGRLGTYDKAIYTKNNGNQVWVRDTAYTDASTFKTAMSGVYLVYELATPTTESADPYQGTQIVNDFGTEEFVDTRTIPIPVGHSTEYQANLVAKLEMSPVSPNGNGEYIVKQTSGENEYISLVSSTTIQNIIARLEALEG